MKTFDLEKKFANSKKGMMLDKVMGDSEMLPCFRLTEEQFPPVKGWKVGKRYKLEIEVEMVGESKNEYNLQEPSTTRFVIVKASDESDTDEEYKAKMGHS